MTEGTSQGLFIVVAIVIFGIFVVMAYILFEDTLSPTLATMFSDATEKSSKSFGKSILDIENFESYSLKKYEIVGNAILMESKPSSGTGLVVRDNHFEKNKNYELTFDYTDLGKTLSHIGGHIAFSTDTKVYIDGTLSGSDWHYVNVKSPLFSQDGSKHRIRIVFNTNRMDYPISSYDGSYTSDNKFYIQPNRGVSHTGFSVKLENIKLKEI